MNTSGLSNHAEQDKSITDFETVLCWVQNLAVITTLVLIAIGIGLIWGTALVG